MIFYEEQIKIKNQFHNQFKNSSYNLFSQEHMDGLIGFQLDLSRSVSAFHLIIWIFAVTFKLTNEQYKRIKRMYGESSKQIINPIITTKSDFMQTIDYIKNSNNRCIIKVVTDRKMLLSIMDICQQDNQIIEVFLYNQKGLKEDFIWIQENQRKKINISQSEKNLKKLQLEIIGKSNKIAAEVLSDFDQFIQKAEKQVEHFTKSFRTFQNSHLLCGDFQKINRYRFRLISFINLKTSDFKDSFQKFRQFVIKQLPWLNNHLKGMDKNEISFSNIIITLQNYYQIAQKFMQRQEKKAFKQYQQKFKQGGKQAQQSYQNGNGNEIDIKSLSYKEQFYHSVVSIYQEQGLFYHFLNSNLKSIGQKEYNWKQLSLPFTHVYNSIKYLFRQEISKENDFYLNPFLVFRGGRIRNSQLKRYQFYKGKIFIEFYGFLSTSLSAKIVADKFVNVRNSIDNPDNIDMAESMQDFGDQQVIFRIKVNQNKKILHQKYDFLVNGFFKMGQFQKYGSQQKQVLFNALNIFKLIEIKKQKIKDLFSQSEKQEAKIHEQSLKSSYQRTFQQQKLKIEYYDKQITVIDLQYGPFYDVLLQKNEEVLTQWQQKGKQNYVYCMNKIRQYQQFDYGDACQLTNQMEECYRYLQTKINITESQSQNFMISLIDNKNYFQRLSTVCNKLGKTKQSLVYTEIAIKCHEQLQNIHLNNIYNQYYQKLLDMQLKCIQIYRETNDYLKQSKLLKKQLRKMKAPNFQEPKAQLRESELYILQAINYYSMGKLQKSMVQFKKCSNKLSKIITKYSLQIEETCQFFGYLKNLCCCKDPEQARQWCYSSYKEMTKQNKRKLREKQLTQKYGQKDELQKNCKMANYFLEAVDNAIANKKKLFKSSKKYQQFISKFSHQFEMMKAMQQKKEMTQRQIIESNIKKKILQITGLSVSSSQHSNKTEELEKDIEKLALLNLNQIETTSSSSIQEFINKFKEKERQKKLRDFKERILNQNQNALIQQYLACADQIQKNIYQLKSQGYVDKTYGILKKRVQKAQIFYSCERKQQAMIQINKIIESGLVEGQNRNLQLAIANSTKGKIQLQYQQIQTAIQSFNKSLAFYQELCGSTLEEDNDQSNHSQHSSVLSQLSENNQEKEDSQIQQNKAKNQLHHNNDYLQTKIFRMKALLIWVESIKTKQNEFSQKLFERDRQQKPWKLQHSNVHLRMVKSQIQKVDEIIVSRSALQDLQQLKCSLLQVLFQYRLIIYHRMDHKIKIIFQPFVQCLQIRQNSEGISNIKSYMMCCEFVLRYCKRQNLFKHFLELKYDNYLKAAEIELKNYSFYWKIMKARYLIQRSKQNNNILLAEEYLKSSIRLLKKEFQEKKQNHLLVQLANLKRCQVLIQSQQEFSNQQLDIPPLKL